MSAVALGLMSACGWGCADMMARFTGRALGYRIALLATFVSSTLVLTISYYSSSAGWSVPRAGWVQIVFAGAGLLVATQALYKGLAHGPVTLVSPVASSYPALSLAVAVATGARPQLGQWLAMGTTMAGIAVVGFCTGHFVRGDYSRADIRRALGLGLLSSMAFAVAIGAGQAAAAIHGELQTITLARWIAIILLAAQFACVRQSDAWVAPGTLPPTKRSWLPWLPLLALQGLLDAAAYVTLFAAGSGTGSQIAIVIGSGYSAITVLLARVMIREPMSPGQWGGIGLIIAGVAGLSAYG